jgi:HAD superfamily hydrolase (TIGR01459 family)
LTADPRFCEKHRPAASAGQVEQRAETVKQASGRIGGLSEIASHYDAVLCDVWGVLHNGIAAWPEAMDALSAFRRGGGHVVMVTNAPRPFGPVVEQLKGLGVREGVYDAIVTSGDVTRELISRKGGKVFHIGPAWDRPLFDGLGVELVDRDGAASVVCTGLFDDRTETPEDYAGLLSELAARDLPFICANPDIVVEKGEQLLWCAGALARDYAALGGKTHVAGKPHAPIYAAARGIADRLAGGAIPQDRYLAIGDGMPTDVRGAADAGLDLLYISAGIHSAEYGEPDAPDPARLAAFLEREGARPTAWMPRLRW